MSLDAITAHNKKVTELTWTQNPVFGLTLPTPTFGSEESDETYTPSDGSTEDILEYYSDYQYYDEETGIFFTDTEELLEHYPDCHYSDLEDGEYYEEEYYYCDEECATEEDDFVEFAPLTTEEKIQMSLDDVIEYNKQAGYELLVDSSEEQYVFVDDKGKEDETVEEVEELEEIVIQISESDDEIDQEEIDIEEKWIEMKDMVHNWKLKYDAEKVIGFEVTSNLLANVIPSKL
jgi:hypothetical protein